MVDRNHWRLGRRLRLLPLVAEVKVTLAGRRGTSLVDGESSCHVCPAHPISLFEGASAKQPFPNRFAPVLEAPAILWRLLRRNGPLRKEQTSRFNCHRKSVTYAIPSFNFHRVGVFDCLLRRRAMVQSQMYSLMALGPGRHRVVVHLLDSTMQIF
jgi:hypothetical protein